MTDKIKGILFDVGGVLVDLDGVPTLAKLLKIEESHEAIHALWMTSSAVVAYETGKISATAFAAGVVADLNLPITPDSFWENFCTWPNSVKPGAFQLFDAIPRRYRVAALSNTSAAHWDRIRAMGLAERFETTYLSHEMGVLKPAAEAFLFALRDLGFSPSEVVFLDDGARNVDAARALGINAHVVNNPLEAMVALEEYEIISPRP